jgi:GH25 family lysozyme M1 (1,4-beta-N-acetylmuramidase)
MKSLTFCLVLSTSISGAQNYAISRWTIGSGGGISTVGDYTLQGTVGQSTASTTSSGNWTLSSGFWQADDGVEGLDVAHFQFDERLNSAGQPIGIDWNAVFAAGKRFAFIKCTEGISVRDGGAAHDHFKENIDGAIAAGLKVAAYHLAGWNGKNPNLNSDPIQEAAFFLRRAGPYIGNTFLPPILDLESTYTLSSQKFSDWVRKWLQFVECETGVRPILYADRSILSGNLEDDLRGTLDSSTLAWNSGPYPLWISKYDDDPIAVPSLKNGQTWPHWVFKQYSPGEGISVSKTEYVDGGRCPGITALVQDLGGSFVPGVDLDSFQGSMDDLISLTVHGPKPAIGPVTFLSTTINISPPIIGTGPSQPIPFLAQLRDHCGGPVNGFQINNVISPTPLGGTAQIVGGRVVYTPPPGMSGTDVIMASMSDGNGTVVPGTITLNVSSQPGSGSSTSTARLNVSDSSVNVAAIGVPSLPYEVMRSTDFSTWSTLATILSGSDGAVSFDDSDQFPAAFYAIVPAH